VHKLTYCRCTSVMKPAQGESHGGGTPVVIPVRVSAARRAGVVIGGVLIITVGGQGSGLRLFIIISRLAWLAVVLFWSLRQAARNNPSNSKTWNSVRQCPMPCQMGPLTLGT
jgi:hypothetical protein